MFSDDKANAGIYLFEETSTDGIYKIRSTSDGINYMNIYTEHGVAGNDKATKAGLATYTIEEVTAYPLTMPEDGIAAVCLPFNVVITDDIYAYDATAADVSLNSETGGYVCTMEIIAVPGETLKGGTPAILSGSEGDYQLPITLSDSEAKGPLPQSILKGNYVESDLTQSTDMKKFTLAAEAAFTAFEDTKSIGANQCWMEHRLPEANEIKIMFRKPVGIHDIHATPQSSAVYNMHGQQLKEPQKGINIIDNRKVLVK
jgi:hypothetical protein